VAPFRTVEVEVGPGVFIPRPETEVMTGWALERLWPRSAGGDAEPVVVELCAGSGAITKALATEFGAGPGLPLRRAVSADASPYLSRNLAGLGVDARSSATWRTPSPTWTGPSTWSSPTRPTCRWIGTGPTCPPRCATSTLRSRWSSGADGLDAMRVVAEVAARLLRPGGWVCAEHAEVQEASAPAVFVRQGSFTTSPTTATSRTGPVRDRPAGWQDGP
jgi:release factor glutamine methyltransferase